MSADNYIVICKHPDGGYVNCMGFMSDEEEPTVRSNSPRFETLSDALGAADEEYPEYGVQLSDAVRRSLGLADDLSGRASPGPDPTGPAPRLCRCAELAEEVHHQNKQFQRLKDEIAELKDAINHLSQFLDSRLNPQ